MKYDKNFIEICEKLGKRIQKFREEKGISVKELSEKTGIRQEYIKKIENGKAYGVTIDNHLLKISIALKTKFSNLFDV